MPTTRPGGLLMARRLPSPPPVLPGFTHVNVLGSGGFADVFLYEQNMPRRKVAVKVMLSEVVNDHVRQMFQAEANLMAQLSSHPAILTVYQASVSADGRPYLVMEFCSSALTERYRIERIPVPEVLRIAVKIGSAIETAHRAGVLHRDIKPSNILLTAYGHPVLSDFGIAATLADAQEQETVGMSIPWSAPEVLIDESPGTVASEVWAFAATVYSLLAGHSPFEVPGQSNKSADLMARINKARVAPIGRPDVPSSLERVLRRAMSRRVDQRPATVLELVRELQAVESELGVPQTPIEVAMDEWATATVSDLDDQTRIRPVVTAAAPNRGRGPRRRRRTARIETPVLQPERESSVGTPRGTATGIVATARRGRSPWIVLAALALVTAIIVPVAMATARSGGDAVPTVSDITAAITSDGIEFRWSDPGLTSTDTYQVQVDDLDPTVQFRPEYTVDAVPDAHTCITVTVNRDGITGVPSSEKCVDVPS